ncbi:protein transport protein Sec24-like At4g32640 isoform X1 [Zingiber officinale]|uniref:protein transport protein Sec24-like At4g32640 isoform X1 n=1 Tax=Zingiber officinale TaxID=94328 RepID=UPI001C4AA7BF|nr:protein transport protein Sec24-like At4g32640 isoform X1 [Zingiber officinale]
MESASPFASGPPRQRPAMVSNPTSVVQTPLIGRSMAPSSSVPLPSPFGSALPGFSRPAATPLASRPPPPGAIPQGPIAGNGPRIPGFTAPRTLPPPSVQPAPPSAASSSIRPPTPYASATQDSGLQSYPGSPPSGASVATLPMPFVGPPASQQFGRPPTSQPLFSGPPRSQPPFAGAQYLQRPMAGSTNSQLPLAGPPTSQSPFLGPPTSQPPFTGPPTSQPPRPNTPQPPFAGLPTPQQFGGPSTQTLTGPPISQFVGPPTSQPYAGRSSSPSQMATPSSQPFSMPPTVGTSFGSPVWPSQPGQMVPSLPGNVQAPPRMFGMPPGMPGQPIPPVLPAMGHSALAGPQVSTQSKIDPNQIPRPLPNSSITIFETRQGNQANVPPVCIQSIFVVKDNGNCSPRLMRCTLNQIPCTGDLLSTSSMPFALMVQPLALPHPSDDPIPVVDFGESGPVRCSRCKSYINAFMRFIDHGRTFVCNLCGFTNETPRDYLCNLGPDGRRRDADERLELCKGTVEFVATREYMVRDPMPAVFFFLIDVSLNAIQTGATAAACSAISQSLADLPDGPRTMVGIATFDCSIHFYNLRRASQQPLMLIVPDIHDVYTPLHTDVVVPLTECRQSVEQLLESIPSLFENNKVSDSAFGAAIKAGFLALKPTGGKLLVFQSVLPSVGIGSLSSREAEGRTNASAGDKEAHKLLQPADKTLKTMAIEFAEYQVCVDIFITAQTFVDIASISVVPGTTGGQVYYYYPFSALSDPGKLYNDLRWNLSRPQGFEAVMRVRCSQGLQVQEYAGSFCKRIPTDIDLPAIDCEKTIMVTFKHDDKFQENSECAFQCALLYTTVYGERRIRVINLSLPCTSMLTNLFRTADLDTQFACILKQAASSIPVNSLSQVREQITNLCINILHAYRKFCATVSSSGQLILPEALKLLPLYTLALVKSIGLRNDGRFDDRSYWASHVMSLSISLAVPLVYPRMISIHDLTAKENDGSLSSSNIPLSSEHINDDGIYLLENGEDCLIYVGNMVNPDTLQKLFGVTSVDGLPTQLVLQQFDNDLSEKLSDVMNEIRQQRCSYLRLRLCKKGDPSGMHFMSYMIEDKTAGGLSYVEFLVHVHRQIQTKMA